MRYEMLNHLAIPPGSIQAAQCLSGLVRARLAQITNPEAHCLELSRTILGSRDNVVTAFSQHAGADSQIYMAEVLRWREAGARTYMLPLYAPEAPAMSIVRESDLSEFVAMVEEVAHSTDAELVFLTCEGQPEARMFELELRRHMLLRWALDKADLVISLVRHDSVARFQDSVAIPSILSRHPGWRGKLRLVLTRSAETISNAPISLQEIVIGRLPFSDFIGKSVSQGRIPYFDAVATDPSSSANLAAREYLNAIQQVAAELIRQVS
jgi:hypothetical protein